MKPEIKYLHSPDIYDLENYHPPVADDFSFLLQIIAGAEKKAGEESFDVIVCSPKWLSKTVGNSKILSGRHHLIMNTYNYEGLMSFIREECEKCSGKGMKSQPSLQESENGSLRITYRHTISEFNARR